jgi:hypothetical protein
LQVRVLPGPPTKSIVYQRRVAGNSRYVFFSFDLRLTPRNIVDSVGQMVGMMMPIRIHPPTMADKLTFTTTLDVSATPKITFTPTGTLLQLTDATITAGAKRTDTHETMGLALPTQAMAYLNSLRASLYTPARAVIVEAQAGARARSAGLPRS